MPRNRMKGKGITFTVEDVDYTLDASSVVLTHEEAENDVLVFADASAGGAYEWKMTINAIQSTDADALHTFVWSNSGDLVDFLFAPHGNTAATVAQPHFTGSVRIPNKKPELGGEADTTWSFEMELDVEGDITRVTL